MKSVNETFNFVRATLSLFKVVAPVGDVAGSYVLNNERNLAQGFFVTARAFDVCPCVVAAGLVDFLKEKFGYNLFELNRSFYKSFGAVVDLTPQQILLNKLLHYMSTYGAESLGIFERELVYVPNAALDLPADAKPVKITVIDAIDTAELERRVRQLIDGGAALSQETLESLATVVKFLDLKLNVDAVPNKEFAIRLSALLNILPADPVQFLRLMIFLANGSTLLIKDAKTFSDIKTSATRFDEYFSRYIAANGLDQLAGIFHRFKPLWLAFKPHSDYLRATINKMRKLAARYHKPVKPHLLERLTAAQDVKLDELKRELSKVTPYKKVSIANAIRYRLAAPESIVYNIRNGKAFVDSYGGDLRFNAQAVLSTIVDSLADDIKPHVAGKRIYIPARFNYAVPVSEKRFVGNVPGGSSYTFEGNSVVVGVHWLNTVVDGREERIDLDLHLNGANVDIGWQNDFNDANTLNTREHKIIFSGDMTDAPRDGGGATEAFFIGETLVDEMLMLNLNHYNRYDSSGSVPFKLILADVTQDSLDRQYLLDAHELAFCVPNEISSGEMFLGFLTSDALGKKVFHFFARDMGNRIAAHSNDLTTQIISAMASTFESALSLRDVLLKAGALLEDVTADDCDLNLDPAEVTKDILLGLFRK